MFYGKSATRTGLSWLLALLMLSGVLLPALQASPVGAAVDRPLAGANVSVTVGGQPRGSGVSGEGGRFSIGDIVVNTGTSVEVRATAHVTANIRGLAVGAGQVESLGVALDHAYGALQVHVVDELAGTPISGATVTVRSGTWTGSGSTGADGRHLRQSEVGAGAPAGRRQ